MSYLAMGYVLCRANVIIQLPEIYHEKYQELTEIKQIIVGTLYFMTVFTENEITKYEVATWGY